MGTISTVTTELKTLDEKVAEASVDDTFSTEIMFTNLRSSDISFSTESVMDDAKISTLLQTDLITEIPSITTDLKTLATNVTEDFEKLNMSTKELLTDSDLHDVKFSKEVIFDVETLPTITTEIKTLVKNVTKKLPTTTTKITKSDERNTEASDEEEISTAELSTDLDSDDISFSTKGVTQLDKIAILAKNDSIVPTLSTELKTVDQNVTELSIEDKISKFSTKEKIKSDYITTISTVTTDLEKLDEKVAEASVEDKITTEIMFTDLGSSDIPFSTESVMDVDKLFTTESRELDKSTEEIITKFPSSGVYFNTDGIKDDSKMSTLLQTDFITEIPFIKTDLTTLATNVREDFEKLEISTEELLTDSDLDDVSFSKVVIADINEVTIFPTNLTHQTSHATTLPTLTTAELSTNLGSDDVSFDKITIVPTNLKLQTS